MAEPVETPRRNLTGAVIPAVAVAGLAALGAMLLVGTNHDGAKQTVATRDCIQQNVDAVGGPIGLVDANGARVTQADFAGQPAVIYFGFTHCPDVCPTTMYTLAEALAAPGGYDVQPILITVDPERDTPQRMGEYTHTDGFPPGLIGLSGTRAQIDAAAAAFQVHHSRSPIPGSPDDVYNVDHSSLLYVVDRNWRTVSIIQTMNRADPLDPASPLVPVAPENIAQCIAAGLERARSS
ncbi:MAG: SCO family protein [Caulobacteraceae bacterium]|nr:SCO family protein [Caulobacteraceae bacterium]